MIFCACVLVYDVRGSSPTDVNICSTFILVKVLQVLVEFNYAATYAREIWSLSLGKLLCAVLVRACIYILSSFSVQGIPQPVI